MASKQELFHHARISWIVVKDSTHYNQIEQHLTESRKNRMYKCFVSMKYMWGKVKHSQCVLHSCWFHLNRFFIFIFLIMKQTIISKWLLCQINSVGRDKANIICTCKISFFSRLTESMRGLTMWLSFSGRQRSLSTAPTRAACVLHITTHQSAHNCIN